MQKKTTIKAAIQAAMAIPVYLAASSSVYALNFQLGEQTTLDWDTNLRYTVAQRVAKQDDYLLRGKNANGDDGNRNFDKNSLIKNRFDVITEADLNFGEVGPFYDLGAFVRGRAWYDRVYNRSNDHDSPATSNNVSKPYNEFTEDTRRQHGRDAEMLDYFLYAGADLGGHDTTLRIGSQALNWGETLFLLGGVATSQGPVDATGFNQPGAELKELFLPVEQIAIQTSLTDNLSMEAYYQWEWQEHTLDAAGSYFSTADMIDEGGESLLSPFGPIPRGADNEARDSGQWGVALRYLAEELNGTEFGLYYITYHDQLPQLTLDLANFEYYLDYVEDVRLWAASFGTVIGSTNISGEVSYRENAPVTVKAGNPLGFTWERAKLMHYSLSGIHIFGANALMDNLSLTAEVAADDVLDMDRDELAKDKFAYGYALTLKPTWLEAFPNTDINLPISLSQGVNGNSAMGGSFTEGSDKVGVTLDVIYKLKYQMQLGYVNFFGGSRQNSKDDRDYVSLALKYSF
ncbi:DUF1302 domain-containing protein [Aestuariirhabdus litorea]|uniref:DUF1302 domain-containing protein n=1 Tax=Aestuariirhabdus litorea TaxID=2528527 RepID=A0A3P3VJ83_9GAMM|nr:DUF1302 domain-containing protein [Aestuariirhabdus litorea]RRJ82407.1 DUF1302 domain-containing protein [Aestuariirhabdus litorea]RWW92570.1 DUF1302 family protein [Endozoicomonadaceae bacterium GTF-13]